MQTKQHPDEIASPADNNAGKSRTLHTQTHSEACRRKAQECAERSAKLTDPKQKAAMLQYAEWWTRLAEIRDSPSVLLGRPDSDFQP
jgi:predicted Rossmann fold nucleotide-binding protein DprA/Smf involved in DNA uptake